MSCLLGHVFQFGVLSLHINDIVKNSVKTIIASVSNHIRLIHMKLQFL